MFPVIMRYRRRFRHRMPVGMPMPTAIPMREPRKTRETSTSKTLAQPTYIAPDRCRIIGIVVPDNGVGEIG